MDIQSKIEKLKEYGISEEKILAIIILGQEEYFENMETELLETDDDELNQLVQQTESIDLESLSPEDAKSKLQNLLKQVYGINANAHFTEFMSEYLDDCILQAEQTTEFLEKYQAGDPETLQQVIDAQKDPDFDAVKTAVQGASDL